MVTITRPTRIRYDWNKHEWLLGGERFRTLVEICDEHLVRIADAGVDTFGLWALAVPDRFRRMQVTVARVGRAA